MNSATRSCHPRGGSSASPPDPEVAGHHALAGEHLEDAQDLFALAEAIEEHAHRADVERVGPQPDQVAVQARHLREQHAHPLRHGRDFHSQQLLHRQAVAEVVGKRRQVVDAVGERHRLLVGFDLEFLFDAGVQIPDVGAARHHVLAVKLQLQPQHAVSGRVLRPHVEDHFARAGVGPLLRRFLHDLAWRFRFAHGLNPGSRDRIILAQWVALPIVRQR